MSTLRSVYETSSYLIIDFLASSVSAMVLLSIGIIPQLYALDNSPNPFTTISSFCKARSYLNQSSAMLCRWLLVMACIDRSLSCSTSARIRRFSSIVIARRVICILIIIWLSFPLHILIFNDIQPPGNIACLIRNSDIAIYHRFYTIIMGGALPVIVSLTCSLHIWCYLQGRRRRRLTRVFDPLRDRKTRSRDQQVLSMLLTQVAIFIISTIPFMSFNIYDTITRTVVNKSSDQKAIEALLKTCTELLVYLITLSFYFNTLISRVFRKEFLKLFRMITTCQHQQHSRRILPVVINQINTINAVTSDSNPSVMCTSKSENRYSFCF